MALLVIFKNIASVAERKSLFEKLTSLEGEILLKDGNDKHLPLTAVSMGDNEIQCATPPGVKLNFSPQEIFTATFYVNNEKYLFETSVTPFEGGANLSTLNLFHLQRRKNFRYTLPTNYAAEFNVTSLNLKNASVTCRILDLSTEGCAILMTPEMTSLQQDDRLEAMILLGDRDPILVQGFVKNLRTRGEDLIVGVHFNHMANSSEHAITTAITEMQREIYLRKAG